MAARGIAACGAALRNDYDAIVFAFWTNLVFDGWLNKYGLNIDDNRVLGIALRTQKFSKIPKLPLFLFLLLPLLSSLNISSCFLLVLS